MAILNPLIGGHLKLLLVTPILNPVRCLVVLLINGKCSFNFKGLLWFALS